MAKKKKLTEEQIDFILHKKSISKKSYLELAGIFNQQFRTDFSPIEIKEIYELNSAGTHSPDFSVDVIKKSHRVQKNIRKQSKETREVINLWNTRDDILEAIKEAALTIKQEKKPAKVVLKKKQKGKTGITKELLLSDIHFGKKTENFNLEICKKRLEEVVEATVGEIKRDESAYNVDEIVIALLGDIIENYSMHGLESAKSCEFGNSRQVYEALINIYKIVIEPLSKLGYPVRVVCVTGNHDRDGKDRTYNNPGEENFTWIIYNALKDFSQFAGLSNVKFTIPIEPWALIDIYGNRILYEHYDNAKSPDRRSLENLMTRRSHQLDAIIDYMRGGHFHEPTSFKNGRIQINGCLTGNDSFAAVLGFNSEASQTLNTFANSSRKYKMYKSFNILLE